MYQEWYQQQLRMATSSSEIVKFFNQYFVSLFTQDADICRPVCVDEVHAHPELCDLTFTTNQVLAVFSSLNVNKASCPDEIPARTLKETAHEIAPWLFDLFNKLLSLGSLPTEWKLPNIVPVYKKENKEYIENYRPISLLCSVSKVMWSVVCLTLLRIKYISWSAAANMASWQSVRALRNWLRCTALLVPS